MTAARLICGWKRCAAIVPAPAAKARWTLWGHLYKGPETTLSAKAFHLVRIANVGGYALQPVWADGHDTGLYSFDYLRRLAEATGGSRE